MDGVAVELPATDSTVGVSRCGRRGLGVGGHRHGGAGDAAGGAESAIVGCRSVSSYVQSFVLRARPCQVAKRFTATVPAAVRYTKLVPTRGSGARRTLVVRREREGDRGTVETGMSDAAPCHPCTNTLPPAFMAC